jgi:hypothetical protein
VRLTSFGYDKAAKKPSADYKTIYSCIQRGLISPDDCIKFRLTPSDDRGPIYVRPSAAADALAKHSAEFSARRDGIQKLRPDAESSGIDTRHAESACESLASIDTTLDEIYRVLERLTTAVESIATQPKTVQQEVLATIGSNGFHN